MRYLENNEKQNIRPLYEKCFDDEKELVDYYFEKRLPDNFVAVNEKDGQIVSAMHLIPKRAIVGKYKTNVMYIYGVGTLEEYRKQGFMKEMFCQVINDLFTNMAAFTYLIPSDDTNAEIYKKYGFEFVMDKCGIKDEEVRKKPTHSLISRKVDNSDIVRLSIFAKSAIEKQYNVSLSKDRKYFKQIIELTQVEGGNVEIYVENRVIVGYRIWIDDEIIEEVLDPSIQSMSWLNNEHKPYAMARVLNIRTCLRLLDFKTFKKTVVRIFDPVIEENNGCFRMHYHHGSLKLDKIDEDKLIGEPDFDLTIGQLTAHIFGYKLIEGFPAVCESPSFFINDYM